MTETVVSFYSTRKPSSNCWLSITKRLLLLRPSLLLLRRRRSLRHHIRLLFRNCVKANCRKSVGC